MDLLTISGIKSATQEARIEAQVHVQVEAVAEKQTKEGKPYWEVTLADAEGKLTLRAWSDSPNFEFCASLVCGEFLAVEGEFAHHPVFGVEARRWNARALEPEEIETLLAGPEALRIQQASDFETITATVATLADPRLRALCEAVLAEFGDRFRRTAAARTYHHARRGGLVEHVAQMMRLGHAIAGTYPTLNRDLLLAGILFHDIGKLWENCPEAHGFTMPFDERGELIGHINIGIELLNQLWRKLLTSEQAAGWGTLQPASDDIRNHLIHLIAAHHGEMAFGSPVFPKTPEAFALHYIDNLDAKLEMLASAYQSGNPLAERIIERVRPLPANLVKPLERFVPPPEAPEKPSLPL